MDGMVSMRPLLFVIWKMFLITHQVQWKKSAKGSFCRPSFRPSRMILTRLELTETQRTPDSIRKIAKEAWDFVSPKDLVRLIESWPARCQAVVDANGGPTRCQGL
ncbi:unnamed protein product [Blumeria hordei]|uniref:Uncharacterized protein n=1 Tax=Blumeria hordei TaxID=2867405 RepID=A0A383UL99_BLUHO|nr:unnamed protein product [Blumeria hordei]